MSGIFVSISSPGAGTVVGRRLTVSGSISAFRGAVNSVSIAFPGGSFAINPPNQPNRVGGGNWSWSGIVPAAVRPGQAFTVTVTAFGTMIQDPPPTGGGGGGPTRPNGPRPPIQPFLTSNTPRLTENEPTPVDGAASLQLVLEDITPQLSVKEFQSAVVTTGPTYRFVLEGAFSEKTDPYNPKTQYQIGTFASGSLPQGGFTIPFDLPPGQYAITVSAWDDFNSRKDIHRTLSVFHYDKPPANSALPQTLVGIPTTASITSWTRLEPQVAGSDLGATAAARLYDPLWMMTRQWQVGEFQGEDAGTPVQARVRATNALLSRYNLGPGALTTPSHAYAPAMAPLEVLAERRAMRPARVTDMRMLPLVVDAGLHFLRMLELDAVGKTYRAAFLARYVMAPLPATAQTDPDAARFVATMAGRALDARALAIGLSGMASATFAFDAALAVAEADKAALKGLCQKWFTLYGSLFSEPPNSSYDGWVPDRLEYAVSTAAKFSATAGDDITLLASEFGGGRLDWHSFDCDAQKLDVGSDRSFTAVTAMAIPAPVTFKGMPAARFWELEDAKVAWGLMQPGPPDLPHLMMIEYAHSFGNDWYVLPLTLPVGSVTRVESLVVIDTFGGKSLLRPIGDAALDDPHFSMWQTARARKAGSERQPPLRNSFLLAPALANVLEGPPLEEVMFMRDEMANLAWGIERTIEGAAGTAVTLAGVADPSAPPPPAPAPAVPGAPPRYRLSTEVAANWVPLMPTQVDAVGTVRLKRASVLQIDGSTRPHGAHSSVLNASANLMLYDEEVPREGVRLTRRRRMARWIDGSTLVWTAFLNEVGAGEGSAGLLFDQVDPDPNAS